METLALPLGCPTLMSALCSHTFACTVPFAWKAFSSTAYLANIHPSNQLRGYPLGEAPQAPPLNVDHSLPWPPVPSQLSLPEPCTWFTCCISLQRGREPPGRWGTSVSPFFTAHPYPGVCPAPCPPGQEPSRGSSYLGGDLVHVSGSQLQSPALAVQKTCQVPGLSPRAARKRNDRRPFLAAPSLWAGSSQAAS